MIETRLCDISPGELAVVQKSFAEGSIRKRLMDIGLIKGTLVKCVGSAPAGEPKAYYIRGAVIAIRADDAKNIIVERCDGVTI